MQRKALGEGNGEIAARYGLTRQQVKWLVCRENRKARLIANGYVLQQKGRPSKTPIVEEQRRNNELVKLRMQVKLLRNFLSEAGRR